MADDYLKKFAPVATCHHRLLQQNRPLADITTSHYRAAYQVLCCNRSGNIELFAAIRRASSFVSNFAAERRPVRHYGTRNWAFLAFDTA